MCDTVVACKNEYSGLTLKIQKYLGYLLSNCALLMHILMLILMLVKKGQLWYYACTAACIFGIQLRVFKQV